MSLICFSMPQNGIAGFKVRSDFDFHILFTHTYFIANTVLSR